MQKNHAHKLFVKIQSTVTNVDMALMHNGHCRRNAADEAEISYAKRQVIIQHKPASIKLVYPVNNSLPNLTNARRLVLYENPPERPKTVPDSEPTGHGDADPAPRQDSEPANQAKGGSSDPNLELPSNEAATDPSQRNKVKDILSTRKIDVLPQTMGRVLQDNMGTRRKPGSNVMSIMYCRLRSRKPGGIDAASGIKFASTSK